MLCAHIILSSPALNSIWSRECSGSAKEQPLCRAGCSGGWQNAQPGVWTSATPIPPGEPQLQPEPLTGSRDSTSLPRGTKHHQEPELIIPFTPSRHQRHLLPYVPSIEDTLGICSFLHVSDNLAAPIARTERRCKMFWSSTDTVTCWLYTQQQFSADILHGKGKGRMGSVYKKIFCCWEILPRSEISVCISTEVDPMPSNVIYAASLQIQNSWMPGF